MAESTASSQLPIDWLSSPTLLYDGAEETSGSPKSRNERIQGIVSIFRAFCFKKNTEYRDRLANERTTPK